MNSGIIAQRYKESLVDYINGGIKWETGIKEWVCQYGKCKVLRSLRNIIYSNDKIEEKRSIGEEYVKRSIESMARKKLHLVFVPENSIKRMWEMNGLGVIE